MSSFKLVWYLPFTALALTFLSYISVGLWFHQWVLNGSTVRHSTPFHAVVLPDTLKAINGDPRLQGTILSVTEAIAKASSDYGETYDLAGLRGLGKNLTKEITRLKSMYVPAQEVTRRGFLDKFLPGGGGDKDGDKGGGLLGGLFGGGGNGTSGLGGLLQNAIKGLGNDLLGSLATPALFLGIGIGMGTSTSLNLTDGAKAQAIAAQVASSMGMKPGGLNQIAQNLGSGLSAQLAPSLGRNLTTSANNLPIGMVAFALAQGIGQGSASGLNLTQQRFEPNNGSDLMAIAGNLGLGVSGPIASSINPQQLISQSGLNNEALMAQIPQIAMAAGQGLGGGAVKGLRLDKVANGTLGSLLGKRQAPSNPGQLDVMGAVGNFTFGLSQSFLQSVDIKNIANPSAFNFNLDAKAIVSFAGGAGKGLGEGLAIGLNMSNGTVMSPQTATDGVDANQEQIAEQLVKGVVAGFLQNGGLTVAKQTLNSGAGGLPTNINPGRIAEGAARGFVEGAVNGLSQAGGLRNVLSGNFSKDLPMNLPSLPPSTFNDSVNGAAVSFTRGLSGEGILLFSQYFNQGKDGAPPPLFKRRLDDKGVVPYGRIVRREDASTPALAIDGKTLEDLAQVGINTLTCPGVGGLAAVGLGIISGPTFKDKGKLTGTPLDNFTLAALPKDPITIESDGNTFLINIQDQSVQVNGRAVIPFGIILALHILFTTLAFFIALPIYMVMGAVMRLSVMINFPLDEAKNKRWRTIVLLLFFSPLAIVGLVLGFLAVGTSKHLRTVHEILGLITLIITLPTIVITFSRLRTTIPQPGPSAFRGIKELPKLLRGPQKVHVYSSILVQFTSALGTVCWSEGFDDLRSISLCVVDAVLTSKIMVTVSFAAVFVQFSAMAVVGARQYLEARIAKFEAAGQGAEKFQNNMSDIKMQLGAVPIKRSSTIRTFGFESKTPPPPPKGAKNETRTAVRTISLQGREDSQIGWPSQVRRFGEADTRLAPERPAASNPFRDSADSQTLPPTNSTRVYNPKLGGFEDDRSPLFPPPSRPQPPNDKTISLSDYGEYRVSSETVPPVPGRAPNEGSSLKKKESFSRPF